jgi:uncharacterized protein (TIGR00255 family)
MTGVGRAEAILMPWKTKISVEIRSLNHKYLETTQRLPSSLANYENEIRDLIKSRIPRGYIQFSMSLEENVPMPTLILDEALLTNYLNLTKQLKEKAGLCGDLDVNTIIAFPGIITTDKVEKETEKVWKQVKMVVIQALKRLIKMKQEEGRALAKDFRKRIKNIIRAVTAIEKRVPKRLQERRKNLMAQLKELKVNSDPKRVLEEIAYISERLDLHEECVRLRSHCVMFRNCLTEPATDGLGKKLDFILQEILRETDTLSAKARDLYISQKGIAMKEEIEKLKEQARNVE